MDLDGHFPNSESIDASVDDLTGEKMRSGTLYLIGTPIGNLGDMSPRAAALLAAADIVVAEDTRRTLRLLNHLGLRKHLESYHEHNRLTKEPILLERLRQNCRMALVTDAGMPGISDPGTSLVAACVAGGIPVVVVPGPCAAVVALAGSGLPTDRFIFEGFLPSSGKLRKERLRELAGDRPTIILYEAPHRLKRTLTDLAAQGLGGRQLALGRELTKRHEEYLRMSVARAASFYEQEEPRGEYVLVLEGADTYTARDSAAGNMTGKALADNQEQSEDEAAGMLRELLRQGKSVKDAVRCCVQKTGRNKNEIYPLALQIQALEPVKNDTE
ncbi:MAG: 16S rRNA (cytidine(1402)-2'-O)-methyltransferase [Clostridiaceae bacterium]|nr:16S rRNA (cytidine(1402)-2'-O)-methyltransferase [Clostridiaceae bacterium]